VEMLTEETRDMERTCQTLQAVVQVW